MLNSTEETELIKKLSAFPQIVEKTGNELRPNIITNYAFGLAKQINEFYHTHNILKEEKNLKNARLLLANCVKQTLKNSLNLLGIGVLERM